MNYSTTVLTLLINLFLLHGAVLPYVNPQGRKLNSQQNARPLSLEEIKEKIRIHVNTKNEKNKEAVDKATAAEIRRRGIDSYLTGPTINELRNLGAGSQTLQALENFRNDSAASIKRQDQSSEKVIILVANFNSNSKEDYRVTQKLVDRLVDSTMIYSDIEVKPLGEAIPEQLGRKVAAAKGKEHNASIVIWGWLDTNDEAVNITAYFEVIPRTVHSANTWYPNTFGMTHELIAGLSDLKWFKLQTRLGSDMTALTLFTTGLARFQAGDYRGAISQLTQALRQGSTPERLFDASDIHTARGMAYAYDKGCSGATSALNDFNEAIRINPKNRIARVYILTTYLCVKKYDDAITTGKKILEDESDVELLAAINMILGAVYVDRGETDQARFFLDKVIQIPEGNPPNPLIIYIQGLTSILRGDYNIALQKLDRVTEPIDTSMIPPIEGIKGMALVGAGNYDRAIKELNEALRLNPRIVMFYYTLGHAHTGKKDFKHAIENFSKYLELTQSDETVLSSRAESFLYRGEAYYYEGDKDKALEDLTQAIVRNPHLVRALQSRAAVYAHKGMFNESISDYNEIIKLTPNDATAFLYRGNVYAHKKLFEAAFSDFNEAIKLNRNLAAAYLGRGAIYVVKGERDKAISDLRNAEKMTDDPLLRKDARYRLEALGVK